MLDVVVKFLGEQLTGHIAAVTGAVPAPVGASRIVDDGGKVLVTEDTLAFSLLMVEEDRVMRDSLPEYTLQGGRHVVTPPDLRLNVHLVLVAYYRQYDQALRYLSMGLQFFHEHPVFTPDAYPSLDSRVERLTVEQLNLSYEQLNQAWAAIGGKVLPHVALRVRGVFLKPEAPTGLQEPLSSFQLEAHSR